MTPDRLHEVLSKYAASKGSNSTGTTNVFSISSPDFSETKKDTVTVPAVPTGVRFEGKDADIICPAYTKTRMYRNTGVVSARFMFRRNGTRE